MEFNDAQSRALAILPKLSGFFSAFFSMVIVTTVLRDPNKRSKTYHRLVCGISLVDFCSSTGYFFSTWPIPKTEDVLWAAGNDMTCTIQAFFIQLGIGSSIYNASLSIYFFLVIRNSWKESRIIKIEPYLHAVPILWCLGTSVASVGIGIFGNATLWCWIETQHDIYRWVFFYGPLWTMILVVTLASLLIYQYVRHLEQATRRYKYSSRLRFVQYAQRLSARMSNQFSRKDPKTTDINAALEYSQGVGGMHAAGKTSVVKERIVSRDDMEQALPRHEPAISNDDSIGADTEEEKVEEGEEPVRVKEKNSAETRKRTKPSRSRSRTMEVAIRCFWFSAAFYVNWTALSITRLVQAINGQVYFPLLLIAAITTPLQGLPNVIVYLYPYFKKMRNERPEISVWRLLRSKFMVRLGTSETNCNSSRAGPSENRDQ